MRPRLRFLAVAQRGGLGGGYREREGEGEREEGWGWVEGVETRLSGAAKGEGEMTTLEHKA